MSDAINELAQRYADLKAEKPDLRIRNAAVELGVSEGELLASGVGPKIIRLRNEPEKILTEIQKLGEVMALTRNESCVHERKGVYENPKFFTHGQMKTGLFVNPDIDLRLFMTHWSHCFAVSEQSKAGERHSVQFFDKSGTAIHKIYLTNKSEKSAFDSLVDDFRSDDQSRLMEIEAYAEKAAEKPDEEIDWDGFRNAWENLKDTHDFFPMLRKFGVGREQGFRKIGEDFAKQVGTNAARTVLEKARDYNCEIMVFVGNRGCIQIHTGPVKKLVEFDNWFNVLDPMFNLHLDESKIASSWVTRKPTEDGIVTALEVFDAEGEIIATFFGKRKPGESELELWRDIISEIPEGGVANAA
ncbi:hemin-degrading factor [Sneathiella glossodoripedis]|uniref:hemin-degrading factor n=1 Tax=Sneathiella glossodoripedis TaxID=418853 RepID=UPI0004703480|nr:hemin-degrading factor [Sneathiella glossodoripedis]